jgi:hypothetical protein
VDLLSSSRKDSLKSSCCKLRGYTGANTESDHYEDLPHDHSEDIKPLGAEGPPNTEPAQKTGKPCEQAFLHKSFRNLFGLCFVRLTRGA